MSQRENSRRPIVGITTDVSEASTPRGPRLKADVGLAYAQCVLRAGGLPVFLPALPEAIDEHLALCDAFVFTGGDDPRTEEFGVASDPRITPLHPVRQAYEVGLLRALEAHPQKPVLGVCLGMQLMSLVHGGAIDQYMPDSRPDAARHWDAEHEIRPAEPSGGTARGGTAVLEWSGNVTSKHKQCIIDPGRLQVLAVSDDGIIEAVGDPSRPFYVGVQWHPERTAVRDVGERVFEALLRAAEKAR